MPNRLSPFEYVRYAQQMPIRAGERAAERQLANEQAAGAPGAAQPQPGAQADAMPTIDLSSMMAGEMITAPPPKPSFYDYLRKQGQGQMPPGLEPSMRGESVLFRHANPDMETQYENVPLGLEGADVMAEEPITPEQQQIIQEMVRQWNQGRGPAPAMPRRTVSAQDSMPRNMGADWRFGEG